MAEAAAAPAPAPPRARWTWHVKCLRDARGCDPPAQRRESAALRREPSWRVGRVACPEPRGDRYVPPSNGA